MLAKSFSYLHGTTKLFSQQSDGDRGPANDPEGTSKAPRCAYARPLTTRSKSATRAANSRALSSCTASLMRSAMRPATLAIKARPLAVTAHEAALRSIVLLLNEINPRLLRRYAIVVAELSGIPSAIATSVMPSTRPFLAKNERTCHSGDSILLPIKSA